MEAFFRCVARLRLHRYTMRRKIAIRGIVVASGIMSLRLGLEWLGNSVEIVTDDVVVVEVPDWVGWLLTLFVPPAIGVMMVP